MTAPALSRQAPHAPPSARSLPNVAADGSRADELRFARPVVTKVGGVCRVEADVDGSPIWFESSDVSLSASVEAFADALSIAALERGRRMILPAPVDPLWQANASRLTSTVCQWWGYSPLVPAAANGLRDPVTNPAAATALLFSGGADSFYSVFHGGRIDYLVAVHGYDITLQDGPRMARLEESLREVAAERGAKAVVMRTNLREHPAFNAGPWERTHGGALSAIGHLLSDVAGRLLISSSYPLTIDVPWGSHWRIDPLRSSSRMEIVYFGGEVWRNAKLHAIAPQPLVRKHLRVCWENRTAASNCSRCEKCLRTMLSLAQCRQLQHFSVFDQSLPLARLIDELPAIPVARVPAFTSILDAGLPPDLDRAVRRLLHRTRGHPNPTVRRLISCGRRALQCVGFIGGNET